MITSIESEESGIKQTLALEDSSGLMNTSISISWMKLYDSKLSGGDAISLASKLEPSNSSHTSSEPGKK